MKSMIEKNFHTYIRFKYFDYIKQHPGIPELIKYELKQVVTKHLQAISQTFAMLELMEKRTRQLYTEKGLLKKYMKDQLPYFTETLSSTEKAGINNFVKYASKKKAKK